MNLYSINNPSLVLNSPRVMSPGPPSPTPYTRTWYAVASCSPVSVNVTVTGSVSLSLMSILCVNTTGDVTFSTTAVTAGRPRWARVADMWREVSVDDNRESRGGAEGTGGEGRGGGRREKLKMKWRP